MDISACLTFGTNYRVTELLNEKDISGNKVLGPYFTPNELMSVDGCQRMSNILYVTLRYVGLI